MEIDSTSRYWSTEAQRWIYPGDLPPLPEPFGFLEPTGRSPAFHYMRRRDEQGAGVFTADQMRAYALAERERCAKLCEKLCVLDYDDYGNSVCAAAIRASS